MIRNILFILLLLIATPTMAQSDNIKKKVHYNAFSHNDYTRKRPLIRETTALGAAYLAGLAVGFWHDLEEIKQVREIETLFTPTMTDDQRTALLRGWHKAVDRSKNWEE